MAEMILSLRSTLRPSPEQILAMGRACGAARFAWNWGLAQKQAAWKLRKEAIEAGTPSDEAPKVPTAIDLNRELNKLKKLPAEEGGFPWMYESSKCAPQEALRDLDAAYGHFFRRVKACETPGFPRFKARGRDPGHFRLTGVIRVAKGRIHLPRIGTVRFMPGDKGYIPDGSYSTVSVVEDHDRWCVSVRMEMSEAPQDLTRPVVGLDAGVRELAHLSDGTVIDNPCALVQKEKRLRRAKLAVARKQRVTDKRQGRPKKGCRRFESNRLHQARKRLARCERRVANIRTDALHKATTDLAKKYSVVVVEKLNGKNMTRRCHGRGRAAKAGMNRAILNSGMLRLCSLLTYKMPLYGGRLESVPAAYTSQTCSRCGARNDPGSSKTYKCESCGVVLDRDHNASLNILAAASCTVAPTSKSERRGAAVGPKAKAGRQAAMIRQSEHGHV